MIVLMGLAGSGKSTQGQLLAKATGRVWLSAGQVLRDTGRYDGILKSGQLVDDTLTIKLMAEEMARVVRSGQDVVLDGFPRNVDQAEWVAENIAAAINVVVRITVPKDELYRRLEQRGRADDTRGAIEKRFAIVENDLQEVCAILAKKKIRITEIDGTGTIEEVFSRLKKAVGE